MIEELPFSKAFLKHHLDFIRDLWCWRCGTELYVEAAHIRFACSIYYKPITGIQNKPEDYYTLPLCGGCHRTAPDAQHFSNEREWWAEQGVNPILDALLLFIHTGDRAAAKFFYTTKRDRLHKRPL